MACVLWACSYTYSDAYFQVASGVKVNVPAEVSVHVATISRLLSDPSADGYNEAIDTALGALERVKMSLELLTASGAGKVRGSSTCHPLALAHTYALWIRLSGGEQAAQDEPARCVAREPVEGPRTERLGCYSVRCACARHAHASDNGVG